MNNKKIVFAGYEGFIRALATTFFYL